MPIFNATYQHLTYNFRLFLFIIRLGRLEQGPMLENRQQESTDTANHPAGFCAMKMFQNKDRVGTELLDSVLATTHQNQAGCILIKFCKAVLRIRIRDPLLF